MTTVQFAYGVVYVAIYKRSGEEPWKSISAAVNSETFGNQHTHMWHWYHLGRTLLRCASRAFTKLAFSWDIWDYL